MSVVLKKLPISNCSPEGLAQIIKDKKNVKNLNYRAFLYLLKSSGISEDKSDFLFIVRNLTCIVALFDKDCEDVYQQITNIAWEVEDESVRETIKQFLLSLISSQPFYTNKVIDRTIKSLVLTDRNGSVITHSANLEILQFISEKMPTYMKFIQQKIISNFPHKSRPLLDNQAYISNILKLSQLAPSYFNDIIITIIERLMKIDVDISHANDNDELFTIDELINSTEDEVSEKLDCLLSDFMRIIKLHSEYSDDPSHWCKVILLAFDSHILKAHIPHNIPFILFYFFNLFPTLKNVVLDYFWSIFADKNQPAIIRQGGIMYLTSFTNRSKSVSKGDFKKIMLIVASWCQSYIDNNDDVSIKSNHTPFYAACQSLLYMFCYRHTDIFSSSEHKKFLDKIDFHLIVHCKLNPLKHCNTHILRMFSKLSSMYEIVTCSAVIERNSRMLLPASQHIANEQYPFKRCKLKLTSMLVHPFFRDMECSNEFKSESRKYKVSENFEDWDQFMLQSDVSMSSDLNESCISY